MEGEKSLRTAADCLQLAYTWQEKRKAENRKPWETPSVAGAFVSFDPLLHHSAEEVLSAADKLMYQKKQQMKEQ